MALSDLILGSRAWIAKRGAITPGTRRAARFGSFGSGTIIAYAPIALYNEHAIHLGRDTLIGPGISLSAGILPGQELLSDRVVTIGDRCVLGRHSSIVAHLDIVIEDDVFFGPNVYVTDQNHSVDDLHLPIGRQARPEQPVRIGAGSWLGTNVVVLPGVTIGPGVAVGAGAVVTSDLPPNVIAAGAPARILRER